MRRLCGEGCVLTWGDLASCLKGRRAEPEREVSRGRSSRGRLTAGAKGRTRRTVTRHVDAARQCIRCPRNAGRDGGRAAVKPCLKRAAMKHAPARHAQTDGGQRCWSRRWRERTWRRRGNASRPTRGAPASMDWTVHRHGRYLKTAWPDIREQLLDGTYRPSPVRRVGIPSRAAGCASWAFRPWWTG